MTNPLPVHHLIMNPFPHSRSKLRTTPSLEHSPLQEFTPEHVKPVLPYTTLSRVSPNVLDACSRCTPTIEPKSRLPLPEISLPSLDSRTRLPERLYVTRRIP